MFLSKKTWGLDIYWIFISIHIAKNIIMFFSPESPVYIYFQMLNAFHPPFTLAFAFSYARLTLNAIHCLILLASIHNVVFRPKALLQFLFIAKVIFDILGHSYEIKELTSLWHTDILLTVIIVFLFAAINFPLYAHCFQYAFLKKTPNGKIS